MKKKLMSTLLMAYIMLAPALAAVTGNTTVSVPTTADAADTASLSIAFVNTIIYSFVLQGSTLGTIMVLMMTIALIAAVFAAITGLFRGVTGMARAFG